MSWKMEQYGPRYKIYWGNRQTDHVRDKEDVVTALKHYLVMSHNRKRCVACREKDVQACKKRGLTWDPKSDKCR